MEPRNDTLGAFLEYKRIEANMSQLDVCLITKMAEWVLDRFEKGHDIPKRQQLHEICRALGIDSFWALRRRDNDLYYRRTGIKRTRVR